MNTLAQKQEEFKKANIQSVIYKIENIINNKVYVGKSRNIVKRLNQYKYNLKVKSLINQHLLASIEKYGIENFIFSIIEEVEESRLNNREIYWIGRYDSTNTEKGYNKTSGGDGMSATLEIRLKISNTLLNVKHSDERRKNESLSHMGVKLSAEHIENIRKSQIDRFKDNKEREKCGIALRKVVFQYDKNNMFIKEWESIREASRKLSIDCGTISKCCNNIIKTSGGYKWSYENKHEEL
jgi:group I intron endonuclease